MSSLPREHVEYFKSKSTWRDITTSRMHARLQNNVQNRIRYNSKSLSSSQSKNLSSDHRRRFTFDEKNENGDHADDDTMKHENDSYNELFVVQTEQSHCQLRTRKIQTQHTLVKKFAKYRSTLRTRNQIDSKSHSFNHSITKAESIVMRMICVESSSILTLIKQARLPTMSSGEKAKDLVNQNMKIENSNSNIHQTLYLYKSLQSNPRRLAFIAINNVLPQFHPNRENQNYYSFTVADVKFIIDIYRTIAFHTSNSVAALSFTTSSSSSFRWTLSMFSLWIQLHSHNNRNTNDNLFVQKLFQSISCSGSYIELNDFIAFTTLLTKANRTKRLQFAYDMYDLDADGVVSSHDVFRLVQMGIHVQFPRDFQIFFEKTSQSPVKSPINNDETISDIVLGGERRLKNYEFKTQKIIESHSNANTFLYENESQNTIRFVDWTHENGDECDLIQFIVLIFHNGFIEQLNRSIERNSLNHSLKMKESANTGNMFTRIHAARKAIATLKQRRCKSKTIQKDTLKQHQNNDLFSQMETNELRLRFQSFVGNETLKRGNIFQAFIHSFIAYNYDVIVYDYLFSAMDVMNQEQLTFPQLLYQFSIICRGTIEQKLEFVFRLFDFDGGDEVSADELFAIMDSPLSTLLGTDIDPILNLVVDKFISDKFNCSTLTKDAFIQAMGNKIPQFLQRLATCILNSITAKPSAQQ